jgi:hypothetical protein
MLADADLALYASKHAGRAQHSFFRVEMREASAHTELTNNSIPAAVAPRKAAPTPAQNRRKDGLL